MKVESTRAALRKLAEKVCLIGWSEGVDAADIAAELRELAARSCRNCENNVGGYHHKSREFCLCKHADGEKTPCRFGEFWRPRKAAK